MSAVTPAVRAVCFERDMHRCIRCGVSSPDLQLHHRRARGMGSTRRPETNLPANLLTLCPADHADIESNREVARENGWLLRQHQDPSAIPVRWNGVLVRLDNDGGRAVAA